jgi:hypothetical protein
VYRVYSSLSVILQRDSRRPIFTVKNRRESYIHGQELGRGEVAQCFPELLHGTGCCCCNRLLLLFKIQHNLVAIPAEAYLLPSDSRTRGQNTFRIPSTWKDVYRYMRGHNSSSSSFVYRVYSSLIVILKPDSQDKSPAEQYLQLKTG